MTALDRYIRLEALGLWQENPEATPKEVVVSFGHATLVLTDLADRPLAHWALAATEAVERVDGGAVYATSPERYETLTVNDPEMVAAIAAVSRAHLRPGPSPPPRRRWRGPLLITVVALLVLGLVRFGPDLVRKQAARVVPPERAVVFGERMLLGMLATRGPLCAEPSGRAALADLAAQVTPAAASRLYVLDIRPAAAAALPGPTLLLDRTTLSRAGSPAEVAGLIALAKARDNGDLLPLMTAAGAWQSLRFIFTGDISDAALDRAARAALDAPDPETIGTAFELLGDAGIARASFAGALTRLGHPSATDPPATAAPGGTALLSDREWVALQGICD